MGFFDQPQDKRRAMPPQVAMLPDYQLPPQQSAAQMSPLPMAPDMPDEMPVSDMGRAPLPQAYQHQMDALFNPGPLQQRYTEAAVNGPGETPHGWKGHGLGALQGFAQGGLPGAILGGVAPGIPQRAAFLQQTLPMLAQQADQEMAQQGAQRQGYHALAQATGYDPITHAPTLPMIQAQAMNQFRLGGLDARNRGLDESARSHRANETGRADSLAWRKQFGEARLSQHQQGLDNGSHQLVKGIGANGKPGWFSVNKADPSDVVQMADAEGNPIGTIDEMLEGGRNVRFQQGQAGLESRFQRGQAGVESRFQRGQEGTESRFVRGQQGMDRRAKKSGGGLLDLPTDETPETTVAPPQTPATPAHVKGGRMSHAAYNEKVKKHGQVKVDAYIKANGITVQ